ncbi:MAG: tetratricopeptide repeat protein [Terrimonas sp.]|nr:tetratricopeptide repeat protein [Terrimonas sp.]
MKKSFTLLLLLAYMFSQAQKEAEKIQSGNMAYREGRYEQAAKQYKLVLSGSPEDPVATYNLALTFYKEDKADSALAAFEKMRRGETDPLRLSKLYYNEGVIFSGKNNLAASIEAYKNALRANPFDNDARENLQKALSALKLKNPPPKKEDRKNKKQPDKQPPRPKLNPKQAEQKLKDLQQKEQKTQQRIQKKPANNAGTVKKDW